MPQLTLRAAAQLRNAVRTAIENTHLDTDVKLNIYDGRSAQAILAAAQAKFATEMSKLRRLLDIETKLRSEIGGANFKTGVSKAMDEKAGLERRHRAISVSGRTAKLPEGTEPATYADARRAALMESRKNPAEAGRSYGYATAEDVSVPFLSQADTDKLAEEQFTLKRQIQAVADKILSLNSATPGPVQLSDEDVSYLREQRIG